MRKKIAMVLACISAFAATVGLSGCSVVGSWLSGDRSATYYGHDVTVTLDVNGGTGLTKSVYEGTSRDDLDLPSPQKEGCMFLGWYEKNGNQFLLGQYPENSVTLTARYEVIEDMPVEITFTSEQERTGKGMMYYGCGLIFEKEDLTAEDAEKYEVLKNNETIDVEVSATWDAKITPTSVLAEASPATDYEVSYYAYSSFYAIGEETIENQWDTYIPIALSGTVKSKKLTAYSTIISVRAQNGLSQEGTTYSFKNVVVKLKFTIPAGTVFK